eukprot:PITA_04755
MAARVLPFGGSDHWLVQMEVQGIDFFKACRNIVKQDILQVVEDSRRHRTILKALNSSFIALIPKQEIDQTPNRFRPIALCNVIYKIISKVAANRLKPLLLSLVSGEQSGYVEGRQILNNIIQVHEVVHTLTSKRKARMIMQLDIAKAYDKLSWKYIRKILIAFGFDHNWVRWILALITSASFSIPVNGSPSETFTPSRGLRQGDPLSPFLFILMMEGLGKAIKHAKIVGKIRGIQLSDNGQALTHQQFVDDTMLQGIPIVKESLAYKQILNEFSMASGMETNLSKSKNFFFNTNITIQRNMSRILGFQRDSLPLKYLGVPLTAKPLHKSIWELMISKLQEKTRKWKIRSLNLAGRLVLTNIVLKSIPIFMLSSIPAPKRILHQMRSIQRNFLWGKGEENKKWALIAWEKMCKPKNHGGRGLDDPKIICKVLEAKLWWRWIKEPKAQWAITWKEKYASYWLDNERIRMDGNIRGSHIWNKAWDNRSLIQDHSFREIREGDLALF